MEWEDEEEGYAVLVKELTLGDELMENVGGSRWKK